MIIRSLFILFMVIIPSSGYCAAEGVPIGCILPLSGKFASFGNKVLQGIELAVDRYNSGDTGRKYPVRLLIKDSQGTPEVAEKAVVELDKEKVRLIVGPILGSTADSAARKAQKLGIPIITMTQKEGVPGIGDWVFRNCITNAVQIKGLLEYAFREGVKKVAVLYPDNPYGRELFSLFSSEVARLGGEVVASQRYKDGQTDFGPEIKALAGQEFLEKIKAYNEEREKRFKEAEKSGVPIDEELENGIAKPAPDFDAVFIADYHERVGLIVPQLLFYDVAGIKLLGISGWNSPGLLKLAGEYLDDTIFVDGFFSGSLRPEVKDFTERYSTTFGEEAGILEAQAYDTMGIVGSVIADGESSRDAIRAGLNKIKDYHGVSGDITFRGRDADRTVYLLTVRNGKIEEVGTQ